MIWQILICTTICRRNEFELLFAELNNQIKRLGLENEVEVLFDEDDKVKSIGKKRQDLLELSTAEFVSYTDSDDWPYEYFIEDIYNALKEKPDCIGFLISMTTNGQKPQVCCHSLRYKIWENNKDGYDYVRGATHFNILKRDIAIQVGFEDIRYAEDRPYSEGVTKLCKTEVFINKELFHYRYSNKINHAEKYGIK